jgi:hypothetical protein
MLPSWGMGFFSPPNKELRGRKIVREFSKDLLEKQSESKARKFSNEKGTWKSVVH